MGRLEKNKEKRKKRTRAETVDPVNIDSAPESCRGLGLPRNKHKRDIFVEDLHNSLSFKTDFDMRGN